MPPAERRPAERGAPAGAGDAGDACAPGTDPRATWKVAAWEVAPGHKYAMMDRLWTAAELHSKVKVRGRAVGARARTTVRRAELIGATWQASSADPCTVWQAP